MNIPKEVKNITEALEEKGFKAYPVGGSVRDILLGKSPTDWDIATDALPEEIQEIFPDNVYENEFGTVAVKTGSEKEELKLIEVTTFRTEGKYSDKRHPDKVKFTKEIEKDLSRRDLTINAMALDISNNEVIDPYDGKNDLENKLIKTVEDPQRRFEEDALRLMRAVRFATELDFKIEKETAKAIKEKSDSLKDIANERIRDELVKIMKSDRADQGIRLLEEMSLLEHIIPELREGIDCDQAGHHIYTVWEHNVRSLKYAAENDYTLENRMASLLHDVGKPRTKEGKGEDATFYNHEVVGGEMTKEILERLKFPKDFVKKVSHLVRHHLFYYNVGEVTESGVRRFIKRVGIENIDDLVQVRKADRIGSGVPKAVPYKLRHLLFMIEKVRRDPITTSNLEIDGDDVMNIADMEPGPEIGFILNILLDNVLDDPDKNNKDYLEEKTKELAKLSKKELKEKYEKAKDKVREANQEEIKEIKEKYHVK